jgi:hypothetical protein
VGVLAEAASALLERIENMTSAEFALGGEKIEREALGNALRAFHARNVLGAARTATAEGA